MCDDCPKTRFNDTYFKTSFRYKFAAQLINFGYRYTDVHQLESVKLCGKGC